MGCNLQYLNLKVFSPSRCQSQKGRFCKESRQLSLLKISKNSEHGSEGLTSLQCLSDWHSGQGRWDGSREWRQDQIRTGCRDNDHSQTQSNDHTASPRERRGRPSPPAFFTTALSSDRADPGLSQLNSLTQVTKLLEVGGDTLHTLTLYRNTGALYRQLSEFLHTEQKAAPWCR